MTEGGEKEYPKGMMKVLGRTIGVSLSGALLLWGGSVLKAETLELQSPDAQLKVEVRLGGEQLEYSVRDSEGVVLDWSHVGLELEGGIHCGQAPQVVARTMSRKSETIQAPLYRQSEFTVTYEELDLQLNEHYGIAFRAYNDGVAYRFYTMFEEPVKVQNEQAEFHFDQDYTAYIAYSTGKEDPFATSFENQYEKVALSQAKTSTLAFTPTTIDLGKGRKVTIAESDLESYPGMFLKPTGKGGFQGAFAPVPLEYQPDSSAKQFKVKTYGTVIAETVGSRTYPWRILIVTQKDSELPVNNLIYALAAPSRIADPSWIHAGKAAWDWWSEWGVYGVDFRVGANTRTYQHFIDFAAKYGLEYVMLDASWFHLDSGNMLKTTDQVDMPKVAQYAKEKGVGIVLWSVFATLDAQLEEACKYYSELGIKGFKVDFLERDDQKAVEQAYRIAEVAAKYGLILDYHGFYKPTGLNRTWPNVVNFEGVFGLEQVKWTAQETPMPLYDVTMPFIRMMAGPVDYTPGAMRNANRNDFKAIYKNPMSQGTRIHQLAEYVVFDSPFAMLCDTPTLYEQEPEYTRFLASIPVGVDETRVLEGELGQFIITARRKGETWFVGGLTNWEARKASFPLSFLKPGVTYQATLYQDGVNAERRGEDYTVKRFQATAQTQIDLRMARGGGFVLKLELQLQ